MVDALAIERTRCALEQLSEAEFFEHVCRPLFLSQGYSEVHVSSGPSQRGYDLLLRASSANLRDEVVAVEVKHRITMANAVVIGLALRQLSEVGVDMGGGHIVRPDRICLVTGAQVSASTSEALQRHFDRGLLVIIDGPQLVTLLMAHVPPLAALLGERERVLAECDYTCAVCRTHLTIRNGSVSRIDALDRDNSTIENLIALCGNCHRRSDLEQWDARTLRYYKTEKHAPKVRPVPIAPTEWTLTIDGSIDVLSEQDHKRLLDAIAALLGSSGSHVVLKRDR